MIHKLWSFLPPFPLYLDVENAQAPIHFEKTSTKYVLSGMRKEEGYN